MTTITNTGTSGVANLPAASSVSNADVSNDGLTWGANVAETEAGDSSFNFDTYAQQVASSMSAAGFSPSQVSAFVNSLYAGYLLDGGTATVQATASVGTGASTAGMVGNPNQWGSLNLPGQGGSGGITVESSNVNLSPSTAFALGQQLGSASTNVNYSQMRANVEADLQRAGYSQSQVQAFMAAFDSGYAAAVPSNVENPTQNGQEMSAASLPAGFNIDTYLTQQVVPWLQNTAGYSSAAMINAYVDAYRAAFLAGGDSTNVGIEQQGAEAGMNIVSANPANFNLEDYVKNTLPGTVSNWNQMTPQQQQIYVDSFVAGYLRAGGTATSAVSTIGIPTVPGQSTGTSVSTGTGTGNSVNTSVSNPTSTTVQGGGTGSTGTGGPVSGATVGNITPNASFTDAFGQVLASPAPSGSVALFSQYLSSSNPTLSGDANTLQSDLTNLTTTQNNLSYAESCYSLAQSNGTGLVADSSGHLQNQAYWNSQIATLKTQQQGAWGKVRKDESKFYGDLSATSGDTNASTAAGIYQQFVNNPWFTLEGTMPSTNAGQPIQNPSSASPSTPPAAVSSTAYNILLTAVSSGVLPPTVTNELTDPSGAKDINQADFTKIVQGYMKLFQSNPSQYWASLAAIKDPKLAGAINFAVQDMSNNHPQQMQANGASAAAESSQIGTYFTNMNKTNDYYYNWAPNQGDTPYNGSIHDAVFGAKWNNSDDIVGLLTDPNAMKDGNANKFSDSAQFMAYLYKNNRPEYYSVLSQIPDKNLRDMLNRDVTLEFVKHPDDFDSSQQGKGTGAEDSDFKDDWNTTKNVAGATAGSSASNSGNNYNHGSIVNGK